MCIASIVTQSAGLSVIALAIIAMVAHNGVIIILYPFISVALI